MSIIVVNIHYCVIQMVASEVFVVRDVSVVI